MKSKKISIIIMAVIFALLLAVFFLINGRWNEDESTDTGEETKTYTVSQIDSSSIKTVSYTNDGKEYSFTFDGSEWKYDADENFPLDTESVTELAEALSLIEAEKEIDGKATDSAEYGLDTPSHTIRVICTDGTAHTYKIGDYNRHSELYYLSYDKSDRIYMVSSSFASVFTLEEEDFLVLEKMESISADAVYEITAEGAFGKITLSVTENESDDNKSYTHINAQGGVQTLEGEGAEKIIKALSTVSLTKCADYYAEEAELEAYGLGVGERTKITVHYTSNITTTNATGAETTTQVNKTCVYYIGRVTAEAEKEEGENTSDSSAELAEENTSETETAYKTYLVLENSNMVFEVDVSSADAMLIQ